MLPNDSLTVSDACILDEYLAVSAYGAGGGFQIHTFQVDFGNRSLSRTQTFAVDGDVTCLAFGPGHSVLAGIWKDGRALLGRGPPQLSTGLRTADLAVADISQGKNTGER